MPYLRYFDTIDNNINVSFILNYTIIFHEVLKMRFHQVGNKQCLVSSNKTLFKDMMYKVDIYYK